MDSYNFWKLDKIDKIFISLICIIFALFSTLQCFAAEIEDVEFSTISGLVFANGVFNSGTNNIGYFQVEPGYRYTVTNVRQDGSQLAIIGSNEAPSVGVVCEKLATVYSNDSYTFSSNAFNYLYLDFQGYVSYVTVTRERITGFDSSVDNLVASVSPISLWNVFSLSIPYILVVVVLALGFYFLRRTLKWVSRGRGNI